MADYRTALGEAVKRCMKEVNGSEYARIPRLYLDDLDSFRQVVPPDLVPGVAFLVQTVKIDGPSSGGVVNATKDRDGVIGVYADGTAVYCFRSGTISVARGLAEPGVMNARPSRLTYKGLEVPAVQIRLDNPKLGWVVFGVQRRGANEQFNTVAAQALVDRVVQLVGPAQ